MRRITPGHLFLAGVLVSTLILNASARETFDDDPDYYAPTSDLKDYVEEALRRNPSLSVALARYRAALQKIPQVTALPDPMLKFTQFIRSVETRVGPQINSVAFSQTFPWFGELDLRGQVAFKEAASHLQSLKALQLDIIAVVKRAYYDLDYADRALEVARREIQLLESFEQLAQARYRSGRGSQYGVVKIQAEMTKILDRIQLLERQRLTFEARLNSTLDRKPDSSVDRTIEQPLPEVSLELEELYALGERSRPELKAAMSLVESGEKAVELAGKSFLPDVTLSAGYVHVGGRDDELGELMPPSDNGKDAYSFSVGLNIPIQRKKYRAEVLEATENLIFRRKSFLVLRNEMELEIREQAVLLETLKRQIDLYDRVLIPQVEQTLSSAEAAYRSAQIEALDLLDSERASLEVRLVRQRYRTDFLKAIADLERAVGSRFLK